MSIWQRSYKAYKMQIEKQLSDKNKAKEVLDILFDEDGDFEVYHYKDPYYTTTLKQRLNLCWIMPLFILTIPFQWVFNGEVGVNEHSKLGKWLHKMTGQ